MSEIFAVGDRVAYQDGCLSTSLTCEVVRVMPVEGNARVYRIRDSNERFERAVPGFTLTLIASQKAAAAAVKPSVSARKK